MQPEDLVGQTLGHYRIKRRIGHGGMATVFLADDIHLGREVALKVFWPRPGETQDFLRRFSREARVLAQLDHPNILPVYDYGEQGELAFLVTPYMSGGTLKDVLLERKAIPPSEAVQLISQVLPALQYAHDRNLIHRDIKPGNLLFKGDGSPVLADFGLVKVVEGDGAPGYTISETGHSIAGTPEYMSPEQINGKAVAASDIYSLGIVLYEMVTGTRPFTGDNLLSVLMKHANEVARPPREINPYVSPQLEAIIQKTLEKDPGKRFTSPTDFQRALQQINKPVANPSSNPGFAAQVSSAGGPDQRTAGTGGVYGPTIATGWTQAPGPASQPVQPRNSSFQNAPTIAASQPGIGNAWQSAQIPPGMANQQQGGSGPATPFPPIQPWAPSQTVPPPLAPQQPQPRRSRTPLVVVMLLLILLAGVVASLFLTPLGSNLFGLQISPTQMPGSSTVPPGGSAPQVRGGHTPAPGGSTEALPPTSTACPATGSARAAVTASLTLGHDPTIVYIVDENDASGNPTYGTVKLYDTVNGKKVELAKTNQTHIDEAQVSNDGQWALFSATIAGQSELRMVRLDGQGLQTLLCAPSGMSIRNAQWSIDQRYVIFDEFPQVGEPTVYLLNMQTGSLQVEVNAPASGIAPIARTWLDYNRVLMVGMVPNSDAPSQNIYILDIGNGAHQNMANIAPIFTPTQPCWDFDSSYDGKTLFIAQCSPGQTTSSSTISQQPATGGTASTILTSSTLSFSTVRVIDPQNTNLLAISANTEQGASSDPAHDGLYLIRTDGSIAPQRLVSTPANEYNSLNSSSQYFWSNISRDGNMYVLQTTKLNGSSNEYLLSYGTLSGGSPKAFVDFNQYMAVAGWTTI